ncbi:MAG: hypothetical protein AB1486_22275 [Planctomycetota bacterium]
MPDLRADNVERLARLLTDLDAVVREPGERRLRPEPRHLSAGGQ